METLSARVQVQYSAYPRQHGFFTFVTDFDDIHQKIFQCSLERKIIKDENLHLLDLSRHNSYLILRNKLPDCVESGLKTSWASTHALEMLHEKFTLYITKTTKHK